MAETGFLMMWLNIFMENHRQFKDGFFLSSSSRTDEEGI